MKINYKSIRNFGALLLFFSMMAPFGLVAQTQTVTTFSYTGALQTWTVPACVGTITLDMRGAAGTNNSYSSGGLGGRMVCIYSVSPGQVLNIYVGSQAGYNGGGTGGGTYGMVGGGASDIRIGGTALSNRVLVAGGGGGAGLNCASNDHGGAGGGTLAVTGWQCNGQGSYSGTGGSQTAGGISQGGSGTSGSLGVGGSGNSTYGGGGGGGYYGGGGASYGGGGGGSSYANSTASNVVHTQGYQSGNGLVSITFALNGTAVFGTMTPPIICTGGSVTLNATGGNTYTWSTAGNTITNTESVVVTPTVNTSYVIAGTNTVGCTSSQTLLVQVDQAVPSLTIANTATNSAGICPGKTVQITASGARTYTWNPSFVNGATLTPSGSSTYVVTGENACGTSTAATSVSIHPLPNVTASRSTASLCSTQSAVVTGGGASTYSWLPLGIQNGVPFYPFVSQTYTVTGTSALGCTATAQTSIAVVLTPVIPPISTPTLICIGKSATVSATGASNYSWSTSSSASAVVVSPTITTTYTVTKWNANCYKTDSVQVIVNQLPTVFAVANPFTVCAGSTATLSAGGGVSYSWTPGNLPFGTGAANINVNPQVSTEYTVTASDGTCVASNTVYVGVEAVPVINISISDVDICFGDTVTYNISGATNYTYTQSASFPTATMTAPSGALTLTTTTNYGVSGVNQAGCKSSASQLVFVNPLPILTALRSPTLVCPNFPSTLTAGSNPQSPAHTYTWAHGATGNVSVVNPSITTTYTVTGKNNLTGCVNNRTVAVAVFIPTICTTRDTAICIKGSINLQASCASSYSWAGGPNPANGVPFYNVSPTVATIYTVTATSTTLTLKCISSKTISVGIFQQPTVSATADRTVAVCRNESIALYGHGAHTYYWPTINQSGGTVVVTPLQQMFYTVIGTDVAGCKDTASIKIEFSNCIGVEENSMNRVSIGVYPNPSQGAFTIEAPFNVQLSVMNSLGQVVREVSLSQENSRTLSLTDLSNGVYFITGKHDNKLISEKVVISK